LGRDTYGDDTPVVARRLARDEAAPLEAVEQTRDVGIAAHQPFAHLAARPSRFTGAAQNAQHVVLSASEIVALEEIRKRLRQISRRTDEIEKHLLLEATEWLTLFDLGAELVRHQTGRCFMVEGGERA